MRINKVLDLKTVVGLIVLLVSLFGWRAALAHYNPYNNDDIINMRNNWVVNVCGGDAACIAENFKDDAVIVIDRTNGVYHPAFSDGDGLGNRR